MASRWGREAGGKARRSQWPHCKSCRRGVQPFAALPKRTAQSGVWLIFRRAGFLLAKNRWPKTCACPPYFEDFAILLQYCLSADNFQAAQ